MNFKGGLNTTSLNIDSLLSDTIQSYYNDVLVEAVAWLRVVKIENDSVVTLLNEVLEAK